MEWSEIKLCDMLYGVKEGGVLKILNLQERVVFRIVESQLCGIFMPVSNEFRRNIDGDTT